MRTIAIFVPGNPPRKDAWHANNLSGRGKGRRLSEDALDWISRLDFEWLKLRQPKIDSGAWLLNLTIHVARRRTIRGEVFPGRDCDSSVSCVLDGLQRVGALDDDVRVEEIHLARAHDAANPRTHIVLREAGIEVRARARGPLVIGGPA